MFGSQALDTAIGLVLVLVVVAQAASAVVDWFSRLLGKRSTDLEATIGEMLGGTGTSTLPTMFARTSVYQSARAAVARSYVLPQIKRNKDWTTARPAYLPAAAFAVAVVEMLTTADVETVLTAHVGLEKRLATLLQEGVQDLVDLKAGLETWFDDTMARLQEAYKRWATTLLFVVGVAIALFGNVSLIGIAQSLWSDSVSREAVVAAAGNVRDQSAPPIATSTPTTPATAPPGNPVTTVSDAVQQAQSYHLPVGWGSGRWPPWSDVTNLATWLVGAVLTGPAPLGATGVPGTLEDQLGVLLGQRPQRASEPPEATPLPS